MFDIKMEGKQPIYEQICGGISALIASGALLPEEKLPTVREVAKSLGVNPNTVQKAYAQLERDGLIYSVPAKGSYVSSGGKAADAIRQKALNKLSEDMQNAKNAGVSKEEAGKILEKIWDTNGGNAK